MNAKDDNGDWVFTDEQLRETPFFNHGPEEISGMYGGPTGSGTPGSTVAAEHHPMILSRMIPASTDAVGHAGIGLETPVSIANFDLNASGGAGVVWRNEFPSARWNGEQYVWEHSDVRNVAYLYTRPFYEFLVELGGLGEDD